MILIKLDKVKDCNMPKSCRFCPFTKYEDFEDEWYCKLLEMDRYGKYIGLYPLEVKYWTDGSKERPEECPLMEI